MAALRSRSDSGRRARGLSVGEDAKSVPLTRWDGLGRTSREWDSLRRDPEIWERNGNCLVHLYAKGGSKRGPSFKLPFSALISVGCFPLIERFLVLEGLQSRSAEDIEKWHQQHPRSTVELYISPPSPLASEAQVRHHHLAVRNLCAWVLGRPMVGEQLGSALIGLVHSMREFRSSASGAHLEDLTAYLRQAGYFNMADEPAYALAMLRLAETFQMKELYMQAFAHCAGVYERLYGSSEYQLISSTSRKLLRKAHVDMNAMLLQTSDMLATFLDDDLSGAHLAIPAGSRAHIERFRSFLLSFYSTKLGYYPPKLFSASLLRTMAKDFEALYDLLVDNNYTCADTMPSTAVGGICTLQLMQSFDERHKIKPLEHPLPRLPDLNVQGSLRLLSRLPFGDKLAASQRQLTHAALVKASNWTDKVFKNDLVRAYRRFEEQSVLSPNKADKNEKVSVVDARKLRWLVIYAVYQILRRATQRPAEVERDEAPYHLAIPMEIVPPWHKTTRDGRAIGGEKLVEQLEIKPDIDYFALTRQDRRSSSSDSPSPNLSRSSSFSMSLKRNSTIRKSLRRFRQSSISESPVVTSPSKPTYHEIVVQGYGNGTQDVAVEVVEQEGLVMKGGLAGRSDSTASSQTNSSAATGSTLDSTTSTAETPPSPLTLPCPTSAEDKSLELELMLARWGPQDKAPARISFTTRPTTSTAGVSEATPEKAAMVSGSNTKHSSEKQQSPIEKRHRRSFEPVRPAPAPAPAPLQRRYTMFSRRKSIALEGRLAAVRIRENDIDEEPRAARRGSDDWSIMQAFMDGKDVRTEMGGDAWAQYADLGGLTDMR